VVEDITDEVSVVLEAFIKVVAKVVEDITDVVGVVV
jgi:hypothetical protein